MHLARWLCMALLTLALPASAATYKVRVSGGTTASTCQQATQPNTYLRTVQEGILCPTGPGDVVTIGPGTYGSPTTKTYIKQNTSGASWDNPITLRGEDPANRPVLRANLDLENFAFEQGANSHYWVIQDLIVDGSSNPNVGYGAMNVADGMKLINVWVRNGTHSSLFSHHASAPRGRYFINVEASGASSGSNGACTPGSPRNEGTEGICHGMYISGPGIVVDGGSFHDNRHGAAIHLHSQFHGVQQSVVKNAKFYNNGAGIYLTFGDGPHEFVNNVFWSNGRAAMPLHESGAVNALNNTFYGSDSGIQSEAGVALTARNNIFYSTGPAFDIIGSSSVTQSHNLCGGGSSGCAGTGTQNVGNTPVFVAPSATPPDFRLRAGSPAIDAGTNAVDLSTDHEGCPRPVNGTTDIGAYERGGTKLRQRRAKPSSVAPAGSRLTRTCPP